MIIDPNKIEKIAQDADNLRHLIGALFSLESEFLMPSERKQAILHIAEEEALRISNAADAMIGNRGAA